MNWLKAAAFAGAAALLATSGNVLESVDPISTSQADSMQDQCIYYNGYCVIPDSLRGMATLLPWM